MAKVSITLRRSLINRPQNQKRTVKALGLGKIDSSVEKELTPQIEGMIRTVNHLVEVKEL